jgi:PKHD-type hydroxylase
MQYIITPFNNGIEPFAYWENAFNNQELDWLQQQAKSASQDAVVGKGVLNMDLRRAQVSWLEHSSETSWLFEKLSYACSRLNSDNFRFDLTGFGEKLQLTNYNESENGMYGWHQDFGGKDVSRKLSMVVHLSDASEYDGGNLQIMTTGTPINISKQRGLITVFPSYMLHQVTPVTRGSRQSLVAWVSGPTFK